MFELELKNRTYIYYYVPGIIISDLYSAIARRLIDIFSTIAFTQNQFNIKHARHNNRYIIHYILNDDIVPCSTMKNDIGQKRRGYERFQISGSAILFLFIINHGVWLYYTCTIAPRSRPRRIEVCSILYIILYLFSTTAMRVQQALLINLPKG